MRVSDADMNSEAAELLVTVGNVVELAAITGPASVNHAENGRGRVAKFIASSEADREGIAWTLAGADADTVLWHATASG